MGIPSDFAALVVHHLSSFAYDRRGVADKAFESQQEVMKEFQRAFAQDGALWLLPVLKVLVGHFRLIAGKVCP